MGLNEIEVCIVVITMIHFQNNWEKMEGFLLGIRKFKIDTDLSLVITFLYMVTFIGKFFRGCGSCFLKHWFDGVGKVLCLLLDCDKKEGRYGWGTLLCLSLWGFA